MISQRSAEKGTRRPPVGAVWVVGGWAATAVAWWLGATGGAEPNRHWGARTLTVAALTTAVLALMVIEVARTWRREPDRFHPLDAAWMFLGTCAWFLGGLVDLAIGFLGSEDSCSGTGGEGSFACLNRPGQGLAGLGWLVTASATGVLVAMFWSGRRSRVAGWLAPALIVGLYVLAAVLWEPHAGFGVPHRHLMP